MPLEFHRRAEHLMWQGDRFATQEAEAYARTPPDWDRTRGVLAISSVALYRKAGDLKQAVQQATLYLKHDGLPESAYHDLQAIIDGVHGSRVAGDGVAGAQRPVG